MQSPKSLTLVNTILALILCMSTLVRTSPIQTDFAEPEDLLVKRALYGILERNAAIDNPNYMAFLRRAQLKRGSKVTNRAGSNRSLCLWKVCPTAPWMNTA
ncbi:uncharacterized protein LOC115230636 [Octopus sinensis]|nr:uncharacterized protein LOC115230636 [Octopus sinensis]